MHVAVGSRVLARSGSAEVEKILFALRNVAYQLLLKLVLVLWCMEAVAAVAVSLVRLLLCCVSPGRIRCA